MAEKTLEDFQIDIGAPTDTFTVSPQTVPTDTVYVLGGNVVKSDDVSIYPVVSNSSPPFGVITGAGMVERWDLLYIDTTGTPAYAIEAGTESAVAQNWWAGIPDIPTDGIPIAAIKVTETGSTPVAVISTDIVDVRSFFNKPQKTADSVYYSPTTSGDWIVAPSEVESALDELAGRVNDISVTPESLHATTASRGTSKYTSHADHQHNHGDLAGVATTHHDAPQVEYDATTLADWTGGVSPAEVSAALDEVGGRLNAGVAQGTPADLGTTADRGSSLYAAHFDHVHEHGDLSAEAPATDMHMSTQVLHTAASTNWSPNPADVDEALEQLADRGLSLGYFDASFHVNVDATNYQIYKYGSSGFTAGLAIAVTNSFTDAINIPSGYYVRTIEMVASGTHNSGNNSQIMNANCLYHRTSDPETFAGSWSYSFMSADSGGGENDNSGGSKGTSTIVMSGASQTFSTVVAGSPSGTPLYTATLGIHRTLDTLTLTVTKTGGTWTGYNDFYVKIRLDDRPA